MYSIMESPMVDTSNGAVLAFSFRCTCIERSARKGYIHRLHYPPLARTSTKSVGSRHPGTGELHAHSNLFDRLLPLTEN